MSDTSLYEHKPHAHVPRNPNDRHHQEREHHAQSSFLNAFNEKLATFVTKRFGSMGAFYTLVIWMFAWMFLATVGIGAFKNDHYPFAFLLFLSNLVQLWALPILAVGQNVLSRHSELMAEEMYHDVVRLLHENNEMAHHLDAQDAELLKQTELLVAPLQHGTPSPASPSPDETPTVAHEGSAPEVPTAQKRHRNGKEEA